MRRGAAARGDGRRLTIALVGLNNKGVVILVVFGIGGACAGWCGGEPRRQHLGQAECARLWKLWFCSSRLWFLKNPKKTDGKGDGGLRKVRGCAEIRRLAWDGGELTEG
jgi:hypothetical protein